jgi:hypothetical protein
MPLYDFVNTITKEEFEISLSLAERDLFLKDHPDIKQLPPTRVNIVRGVGGIKNDGGWNENLDRIANEHPTSELASSRSSRLGVKASKTRQAVEKWKKKRQADLNK